MHRLLQPRLVNCFSNLGSHLNHLGIHLNPLLNWEFEASECVSKCCVGCQFEDS